MMRIEIVTLFPDFFEALQVGLLGKAVASGIVELEVLSPREFAADKHMTVDDAPYGGGSGMLLMVEPFAEALDHLDKRRASKPSRRILLTPQGHPFEQPDAMRLSKQDCLTLLCGRYEGFDERIRGMVHEEISLGDFVLLGGEVGALAVVEATCRLLPGVLGNEASAVEESYAAGLLEYPQYTRPAEFRGMAVPEVLLSGHHGAIAKWRHREALRRTLQRRPDLIDNAPLCGEDRALLEAIRAEERDR